MKSLYKFLLFAFTASVALTNTACSDEAPGDELTAPEMSTNGAVNIARTTCTVSGKYSGNLSKISEYGVKYSTSNNFPTDATTVMSFSGQPNATVNAELENLSPNTHYYYCWYASTGQSVVTSTYGEFTTTSTAKPEFSEITVDSVGESYMLLRCRIIEVGDQYLIEEGISYRAKSNASASFIPVTADGIDANNEFTVELNDLSAATTYEVRPYAKNSSDAEGESGMLEGYGDTQTVTTENKLSPELETYDATDVTMNSARVLAVVTAAEGSYGVITERGFCYSDNSQNPTIYDNTIVVDGLELNEVFEATITDLDQLTTYYVRPYAKNMVNWQERVGYGSAIAFTTTRFTSPQVSFTNQDDATVTSSTVYLQAQIENYYPTALVERGFIWSTDDNNISIDNAKSVGNYVTVNTTDKVFFATLQDLQPNTQYYVRAYAIYQMSGEIYSGESDVMSYTTHEVASASFKDLTCTDKTSTTLSLTTGISDLGDGVFSEKGFCWRMGSGVTVTLDNCDGSQVVQSEDNYNYSATLTGLRQATGYTIRSYVKTLYNWTTVIAYSDAIYCETVDLVQATLKDITCTALSTYTLTVESGISNLGNGDFVEKGFIWKASSSGTPTLENCDGSVKADGTDRSSFSVDITGLEPGTSYRLRSYVKTTLEGIIIVGYSDVITCTTMDRVSATMNSVNASLTDDCIISMSSGISSLGTGELVEKGFCWKAGDVPTLEDCDGSVSVNSGTDDAFFTSVNNLHYNTSYYIRSYAITNIEGEKVVSYSSYIRQSTVTITIDYTVTNVSDSYIQLSLSCSEYYANQLTAFDAAVIKSGDEKVTPDSYQSAIKDESTNTYSVKIEGLTSYTEYVILLRAKHKDGYYITQETSSISTARKPSKDDINIPSVKF
jgi:hypothetical protein